MESCTSFPVGRRSSTRQPWRRCTPVGIGYQDGQIFHAAGASANGWTIVAIHESQESWERFRDGILMPRLQQGVSGGFTTQPQETAFRSTTSSRNRLSSVTGIPHRQSPGRRRGLLAAASS